MVSSIADMLYLIQRKVYKEDSGALFWDKVDNRLAKIRSLAKGDAALVTR
jgi:hypothetical protein